MYINLYYLYYHTEIMCIENYTYNLTSMSIYL